MDAFEPNVTGLLIFAAGWAAFCAGAIHVAGMLPISTAPEPVRSPFGVTLVALNVLLLAGVLVLTLAHVYGGLRWSSAIVVGGVIFLFAPFLVQDLPERFKNGMAGLGLLFLILLGVGYLLFVGGDLPRVL